MNKKRQHRNGGEDHNGEPERPQTQSPRRQAARRSLTRPRVSCSERWEGRAMGTPILIAGREEASGKRQTVPEACGLDSVLRPSVPREWSQLLPSGLSRP